MLHVWTLGVVLENILLMRPGFAGSTGILVTARYFFYDVDRKDREPEGDRHLFEWPVEGKHLS